MAGNRIPRSRYRTWRKFQLCFKSALLSAFKRTDVQESRILSIESTYYRKIRLNLLEEDSKKESFEVFADDDTCSSKMINVYEFPGYLFSKSWSKSNGFAGLKDLKNGNGKFYPDVRIYSRLIIFSLLVPAACEDDQWSQRLLLARNDLLDTSI